MLNLFKLLKEAVRGKTKKSDSEELNLLCFGFVRQSVAMDNFSRYPIDISKIIFEQLLLDWKWDFEYNTPLNTIVNNKTTINCRKGVTCAIGISNIVMKPNTGEYKIKIKINQISNGKTNVNGIGLCATTNNTLQHFCKNINSAECLDNVDFRKVVNNGDYSYIIWPCTDHFGGGAFDKNISDMGFYDGSIYYEPCHYDIYDGDCSNDLEVSTQILNRDNKFVTGKIKYVSNNEYYGNRIPSLRTNDIIIMTYDSDNNILYFKKENDKKLDVYIENLPQNMNMYWIVPHCRHDDDLSMTIL